MNTGISYPGADDEEFIAPATVFYKNAFGGTVCSMAFHHEIMFSQFNENRKDFFIEIIERLKGQKMPLLCNDAQNVTVITREYGDGAILAEVCNINFAPLKKITLRSAETPEKIQRLRGDGNWENVSFVCEGENIILDHLLNCYELVILKIS